MSNITVTFRSQRQQILRELLTEHHISKKSLSAIKRNGALIVNGRHVTVRHILQPDDEVIIVLPPEKPSPSLLPADNPVDIAYEDDYLCIANKPAGINTMPSQLHPHDSLLEQVLFHFNGKVPHIVTRLDRNTSGLVVFAKHQLIHHWMTTGIDKTYLCAVKGRLPSRGRIELPIRRKADSIIERETAEDGKYALTTYLTLHSGDYSAALVRLHTGRTHQIRVHFSAIGHPLLGDTLYGTDTTVNRQALHAFQLAFIHPVTGISHVFQSKPADDLSSVFPML